MAFVPEIDALVSQCRLAAAGALLDSVAAETPSERERLHRARAFVQALAGNDRGVAASALPELINCRDAAGAAEYLDAIAEPDERDYLSIAVVLTWSGEPQCAYEHFRLAHDRAVASLKAFDALKE